MAERVFISYRRDDAAPHARNIHHRLSQSLGARQVFMDVDAIGPGHDFVEVLESKLERVEVMLAVIGPGWLTAADAEGRRRIEAADDFVRREIAVGLARSIPVIPVLVERAQLPKAADLPADLAALVRRQSRRVSHENFEADMSGLERDVRALLRPSPARRRLAMLGAGGLAVAGLLAALLLWSPARSLWQSGLVPPAEAALPAKLVQKVLDDGAGQQPADPSTKRSHLEILVQAARDLRKSAAAKAAGADGFAVALKLLEEGDIAGAEKALSELAEQQAALGEEGRLVAAQAYRQMSALAYLSAPERSDAWIARAVEYDPEHPEGWYWLGYGAVRRGDVAGARSALERVLTLTGHEAFPSWHTPALVELGYLLDQMGDLAGAEARFSEAVDVAEKAGRADDLALALRSMAGLKTQLGDLAQAEQLFGKVLAYRQGLDQTHIANRFELIVDYLALSNVLLRRGYFETAEKANREAEAVAKEVKNLPLEASIQGNLAFLYWSLGRMDQAMAAFERLDQIDRAYGTTLDPLGKLSLRNLLLISRGRFAEAETVALAAQSEAERTGNRVVASSLCNNRWLVVLVSGRFRESRDGLLECARRGEDLDLPSDRVVINSNLAIAERGLGNLAEAERRLDMSKAADRSIGFLINLAYQYEHLGRASLQAVADGSAACAFWRHAELLARHRQLADQAAHLAELISRQGCQA